MSENNSPGLRIDFYTVEMFENGLLPGWERTSIAIKPDSFRLNNPTGTSGWSYFFLGITCCDRGKSHSDSNVPSAFGLSNVQQIDQFLCVTSIAGDRHSGLKSTERPNGSLETAVSHGGRATKDRRMAYCVPMTRPFRAQRTWTKMNLVPF